MTTDSEFWAIVADLEPEPWIVPRPEPPLWRAILEAVWELVWPRLDR